MRGPSWLALLAAAVYGAVPAAQQLANSVAAHPIVAVADKAALAKALKAGADSYAAATVLSRDEKRDAAIAAAKAATDKAAEEAEKVAEEVKVGQEAAASEALQALKAASFRTPTTSAAGKTVRELESNITAAEAEAKLQLDALNEVKSLEVAKHKAVDTATTVLAKIRKQRTQTAKEEEVAAEVAQEKKDDLKGLDAQVAEATKSLEAAKTEEEAVSAMEEKKSADIENAKRALKAKKEESVKRALKDAALRAAVKETPTIAPAAVTVAPPASNASPSVTPPVVATAVAAEHEAKDADADKKLEALKAENLRLKNEKLRLAKQVEAQDLEKQNAKLKKEAEELATTVMKGDEAGSADKKEEPAPSLRKTLGKHLQ